MRAAALALAALITGCTTAPAEEQPLSATEQAAMLAAMPREDREAFELLIWARDADSGPIVARFNACIDQRTAGGSGRVTASDLAGEALDACFPIAEPLIRGVAMRVPALATGATGADLNSWADIQAKEQRDAFLAALTTRIEASRASEADK